MDWLVREDQRKIGNNQLDRCLHNECYEFLKTKKKEINELAEKTRKEFEEAVK